MKIKIAASILSADFSCLDKEIKRVEAAGADMLHIDVMDGHFVPNITIGPEVVRSIRKVTKLPLDVHLMIENPARFVREFLEAGSDMLTLHAETISPVGFKKQAAYLKKGRVRVGISLNPDTPVSRISGLLTYVDFILAMSVNPGFGGQKFIPSVLPKIKKLRSMFKKDISVDGGINDQTARYVIQAGANVLAVGSYIFGAKDTRAAIERLRHAK